jgi:hypothetical protein
MAAIACLKNTELLIKALSDTLWQIYADAESFSAIAYLLSNLSH